MQQRAQPVYTRLVLIGIRIRRVNRVGAGHTMMIWSSRGVKMTRRNLLDADEFDLPRERFQTNNSARLALRMRRLEGGVATVRCRGSDGQWDIYGALLAHPIRRR